MSLGSKVGVLDNEADKFRQEICRLPSLQSLNLTHLIRCTAVVSLWYFILGKQIIMKVTQKANQVRQF